MTLIKFVRTVKYNGEFYPAHTPFKADEKDLPELKAEGAILLEGVIENETSIEPEDVNVEEVEEVVEEVEADLDSLTVSKLRELAEVKGLNVSQFTKKADIIAFIQENI